MENHVTSLELSKKLKELGMKQSSMFYWLNERERNIKRVWAGWYLVPVDEISSSTLSNEDGIWEDHIFSSFTSAELGDIIPWDLKDGLYRGRFVLEKSFSPERCWKATYVDRISGGRLAQSTEDKTMANTMAKLLIYLIEDKLLDIKK